MSRKIRNLISLCGAEAGVDITFQLDRSLKNPPRMHVCEMFCHVGGFHKVGVHMHRIIIRRGRN